MMQVTPKSKNSKQTAPQWGHQPIEAASFDAALLKIKTVSAITGLSAPTIYRKLAAKQFPEPVRLGTRCTRWPAAGVRAWLAEQASAPKAATL